MSTRVCHFPIYPSIDIIHLCTLKIKYSVYTITQSVAANRKNDMFLDQVCDGCDRHALCVRVWIESFTDHLNIISGLCQTHCKQVPEFSRHFYNYMYRQVFCFNTHKFAPVPTCGSLWVVFFGLFFLGPLLQCSHWTGHLLRGQIRESLFYIMLQIWPEPS